MLPKSDNECGKYGRKLIYTLNQIMAFIAPVFMKFKSLSESMWTSCIPLCIHIGAKRSKNGQKSTALTESDFTTLKADQRHYLDILHPILDK
jgi:hypothetical protein